MEIASWKRPKKLQAMSYGERKAKREQEIAGLKEALTILSGESLLQVKTTLRGARRVYAPQRVVFNLDISHFAHSTFLRNPTRRKEKIF